MARRRHRTRRRRPPRALWVLVAALIATAALVWLHRRGEPAPEPPLVSDRQQRAAAALAALRADPSVADAVHAPAADQWDVTPAAADADPTSFARYVCFVLDARRVAGPATSVRVIDEEALETSGFDYNAASRGRLTCEAETR